MTRTVLTVWMLVGLLGACSGGKETVGDVPTGDETTEPGDVLPGDVRSMDEVDTTPAVPDVETGEDRPEDQDGDGVDGGDGSDAGGTDSGEDLGSLEDTSEPEIVPCDAGKPCDDGDPCTQDDTCTPQGTCEGTAKVCDDGDPCNGEEVCGPDGECGPGDSPPCDDDNPCTDDECVPVVGCIHPNNTLECDDDDACTVGDQCADGLCVPGEPASCDDGEPCTDDSCDPAEGCKTAPNTAECDDGNACTVGDLCSGGTCQPGVDSCECTTTADCAWLDNEDLCDGQHVCDTSVLPYVCKVDPDSVVQCPASGLPCLANQCDPATGQCASVQATDGLQCDDEDPCTLQSACLSGLCVGEYIAGCGIGGPCVGADGCMEGQTCLYDLPGGYCTKSNCLNSGCPFGTTCLLVGFGPGTACYLDCDSDSDCRVDEGYECTPSGVCACGKTICEAGQPACNGALATTCNACGSGFEPGGTDCSADGKKCVDGACQACDPGPCDNCEALCPADQTGTGPVCGIDGITYDSFCKLKCAIGSPECTALSNCHQMAYPFACTDFCVVEEAEPIVVGDPVPAFQCKDLNTSSATFQAPVSDFTLKQLVWIAYFGSCT